MYVVHAYQYCFIPVFFFFLIIISKHNNKNNKMLFHGLPSLVEKGRERKKKG